MRFIHHVDERLSLDGLYHWAMTDRKALPEPASDGAPVIGGHE